MIWYKRKLGCLFLSLPALYLWLWTLIPGFEGIWGGPQAPHGFLAELIFFVLFFSSLPALYPTFSMFHSVGVEKEFPLSLEALPPEYRREESWRLPTDVPLIEQLKADLIYREERALLLIKEDARIKLCESVNKKKGQKEYHLGCLHFARWFVKLHVGDKTANRVVEIRAEIERVYAGQTRGHIGQARVRIQKLKRRRADYGSTPQEKARALKLDERIIELEHELKELERFTTEVEVGKRPHPSSEKFQDKKEHRVTDVRDEIFESLELNLHKGVELAKARNEWLRRIKDNPELNETEKQSLTRLVQDQFTLKDPPQADGKPRLNIHKGERS